MTVSVVIPAYNSAAFIAAAIDSVMRQTRPVSEIIVIDDGSTDSTREIVAAYPQLKMLSHNHQGPSAARNAGIQQARGPWVAFLDSDDLWMEWKIEKQLSALEAHPSARFSFSTISSFHTGEVVADQLYLPRELRVWLTDKNCQEGVVFGDVYEVLLNANCVHTSSVLAHRDALNEAGMFDETRHHGEDHDLWLRLSRRSPTVYITEPVSRYRVHSASLSGDWAARGSLFYRSSIEVLSKHRRRFPSVAASRALASAYNGYASFHLKNRDWSEARQLAARGLFTMPTPKGIRLLLESAFPIAYSQAANLLRGGRP